MTLTPGQEAILRAMAEDARWDARELHRTAMKRGRPRKVGGMIEYRGVYFIGSGPFDQEWADRAVDTMNSRDFKKKVKEKKRGKR